MNDTTIMMTRAERLIIEKLEALERKFEELREEKACESIEEISLHKAARLLRIGTEKLIELANAGKLRAITYRDNERKKRYRFRLADIREYQKKRSTRTLEEYEEIETAEDIANRVFGTTTNKRKEHV
jgi:hypothetical protein